MCTGSMHFANAIELKGSIQAVLPEQCFGWSLPTTNRPVVAQVSGKCANGLFVV